MEVVYTFKDPDWVCIWSQPGDRESNYPDKNRDFGMVFHGDEKLILDRDGTRYEAPEKAREFRVPASGVEVYRIEWIGEARFDDPDLRSSVRIARRARTIQ